MPIWLRKFTYKSIVENKQAEADAHKGATSSQSNNTQIDLSNPDRKKIPNNQISPPNYITRTSRK